MHMMRSAMAPDFELSHVCYEQGYKIRDGPILVSVSISVSIDIGYLTWQIPGLLIGN